MKRTVSLIHLAAVPNMILCFLASQQTEISGYVVLFRIEQQLLHISVNGFPEER